MKPGGSPFGETSQRPSAPLVAIRQNGEAASHCDRTRASASRSHWGRAELERVVGHAALLDARRGRASRSARPRRRAVDPDGWRDLMPAARAAAGRLADQGVADVTQGGEVVDVRTARGPVRIRRRSS